MGKRILVTLMASFCVLLHMNVTQAEEQREEGQTFPSLSVVQIENEDGRTHHLMLGNVLIYKDEGSYLFKINSIFDFEDSHVVLAEEYSGGTACPMQLRFITIPQGYSPPTPAPTSAEPWWKTSYHWLLSLIGLKTPAESSRIASADNQTKSPSGIIVSESFGSCSDIYAATRNFGFYDGASPLIVVTKGFVGPGFGSEQHTREYKEAMRDRIFSYTPGTTKTQK